MPALRLIYSLIYSPAGKQLSLYQQLFKAKPKRAQKYARKPRKTPIPNRVSIDLWPAVASDRSQFCHWEGDLVHYQCQHENLLTLQGRKFRLTLIAKNSSKHKKGTHQMICSRLKLFPKIARKYATLDNGGEFADHEKLHSLECKAFLCDPYTSWQKSGFEHANGRIRRLLPKHTNLAEISHAEIERIQRILNNTPMKCLDYQTPTEVFLSNINTRCTSN